MRKTLPPKIVGKLVKIPNGSLEIFSLSRDSEISRLGRFLIRSTKKLAWVIHFVVMATPISL